MVIFLNANFEQDFRLNMHTYTQIPWIKKYAKTTAGCGIRRKRSI